MHQYNYHTLSCDIVSVILMLCVEVVLHFLVWHQVPGIYWEGWLSVLLAVALRFRNFQVYFILGIFRSGKVGGGVGIDQKARSSHHKCARPRAYPLVYCTDRLCTCTCVFSMQDLMLGGGGTNYCDGLDLFRTVQPLSSSWRRTEWETRHSALHLARVSSTSLPQ